MKEHPILFSGEMVRAILEGRKTQTRRVNGLDDVKNYTGNLVGDSVLGKLGYKGYEVSAYNLKPSCKKEFAKSPKLFHWFLGESKDGKEINPIPVKCPYGVPGARLWVRETWALQKDLDEQLDYDGLTPGTIVYDGYHVGYRADGSGVYSEANLGKWRPSIFMPRWASRITLEIVSIRVERLQDISLEDALAEGVDDEYLSYPAASDEHRRAVAEGTIITRYRKLWDSINYARGFDWNVNPWVWVIEFKKVTA